LLGGGGEKLRPARASVAGAEDHGIVPHGEPQLVVEKIDGAQQRGRGRLRAAPGLAVVVADDDVAAVADRDDAMAEMLRVDEHQPLHRGGAQRAGLGQHRSCGGRRRGKKEAAAKRRGPGSVPHRNRGGCAGVQRVPTPRRFAGV
jgi:hypothetical protein